MSYFQSTNPSEPVELLKKVAQVLDGQLLQGVKAPGSTGPTAPLTAEEVAGYELVRESIERQRSTDQTMLSC